MEFWELRGTDYASDYKREFVKGQVEHPYRLPSVRCPVCRNCSWDDNVLPYVCPSSHRKKFSDPADVTIEEFGVIAKTVKAAVEEQGLGSSLVQPGSILQPSFLDIASKPTSDFLWASLNPVVSQRIQEKLESLKVRDIAFAQVTLRKVGKKSARLAPPIPSTGEPEDMVNEVSTTEFPNSNRRYFELCIYGRSAPPPLRELRSVCPTCGSKTFNWATSRKLIMTESMWTGGDIFYLETTRTVLITDFLKQELEKLRPTNVEFTRFPSAWTKC